MRGFKRVRASVDSWMNALVEAGLLSQLDIYFDGMAAMLSVISLLARRRTTLRGLIDQQPPVHRFWETIPCANPDKGRVLRELAAEERFPDLTDGLRVDHGEGFAMLITGTGAAGHPHLWRGAGRGVRQGVVCALHRARQGDFKSKRQRRGTRKKPSEPPEGQAVFNTRVCRFTKTLLKLYTNRVETNVDS